MLTVGQLAMETPTSPEKPYGLVGNGGGLKKKKLPKELWQNSGCQQEFTTGQHKLITQL